MPPHITIIIIDHNPHSRQALETMLNGYGDIVRLLAVVDNFAEGIKAIQRHNPMIVVLNVAEIEQGIEQVRYIVTNYQRTSVFVTTYEKNTDWILRLVRAGAIEYLLQPIDKNEMVEALQKIGRIWLPTEETPVTPAKVITVYNPLGGMGTTTVAVNLAASLAAHSEKVALVDLNLFSGDVASFLNITPSYTLSSVTTNVSRLDASFLKSVMQRHTSGMYVLTEPIEVDEASDITPEQLRRTLNFLRKVFEYVVLDTGGHLPGCNLAVFEMSDHILYNTVLTLPALRNAQRYLQTMTQRGLHKGRVKLVVNRYAPRSDIRIDDAEKVLDCKVYATIPNDYADVVDSINKGEPVVRMSPRSVVSKAISALADQLRR